MKTRANSFLKSFFLGLLVSTLFVSCGGDNNTGTGRTSADPWGGTVVAAGNGSTLPTNWQQVLYNEYPCNVGGYSSTSRITINVQSSGQLMVNSGSMYVGVTYNGDILIIRNESNRISAQIHACQRPGLVNNGAYLATQPVLNVSRTCSVGEITAADISLNSNNGYQYPLVFYPIGLSSPSSLCSNSNTGGGFPPFPYY